MKSVQPFNNSLTSQSLGATQDFHVSMALAPILAAFLQVQFSRSSMFEAIESHRRTATGDGAVAPGMNITDREAEVIDTFVAGLDQYRLELHGPRQSTTIMDVLSLASTLNVDDVLDVIAHDIKAFGSPSHQALLVGMTERDQIFLKNDVRSLAVMADAQFALNVHDAGAAE